MIECLSKYQRWRKGEGEYEWNGDPEKERPIPFSAEALSIVENSAILIIRRFIEIKNGGGHEIE